MTALLKLLRKLKSSALEPIDKAEAIRNPWGLAHYLSDKHGGSPGKYAAALQNKEGENRKGKDNAVAQGDFSSVGSKKVKTEKKRVKSGGARRPAKASSKSSLTQSGFRSRQRRAKKSSDSVTQFVNFISEGNIPALNKMISNVDDSSEGLFMQAVRKAMGKHSEQYKDIGNPKLLKAQSESEPLQKVSPQLAAFLAGLALSDDIVRSGGGSPRGEMTGAQAREWERTISRQMKRKSLKPGTTMEDLQKHWSDQSDTYVRRVPVAKGVSPDDTFLDKKLSSPPRAGEVWNPVSHRWTKDGNLGKVNVGSGGKKRFRAGSNAAGAHQRSVGGLGGKGKLRHLGTGRQYRSKIDIAESASGTSAGVGSAKGAATVFRTGAKKQINSGKSKSKASLNSFRSSQAKKRKK